MAKKKVDGDTGPKTRSVLDMSSKAARDYFLEPSSYCSIDLPDYFQFSQLLQNVENILATKTLKELSSKKPRDFENVNHSLYNNKDGRYAWRPLQIIHPAIYVSLVNEITKPQSWKTIKDRFAEYQANPRIRCLSIPLKSLSKRSTKAEQILNWWNRVEQASVELSIVYDYTLHTDVVDCYGAIYTHSIAWAVHTKPFAKVPQNRTDASLIGNIIDSHIQDMRYGQTNGIPQGSALMDFVAEMVLGYADTEISKRLDAAQIADYEILRYRDDYRVFTNSSQDGERILKCITEVMIDLGLKLGASKTKVSNSVVESSIKQDKLDWICRKQSDRNLQKQLLIIHQHSFEHPNSGSLITALDQFHRRVVRMERVNNPMPIIGILVDIAFHNPRTYPIFAAILSKLLKSLSEPPVAQGVVEKIKKKFEKLPNTGHMQLWLQRISQPISTNVLYDEPLCKLVSGESPIIWNNDWISSKDLLAAITPELLVDRKKLGKLSPVVPVSEMAIFVARDDYR